MCIERPETLDKDQSHSTDKSLLCEKCAQIYKFLGFDYSCLHQQNIWMFFKQICFCNVVLKRFKTRFPITNIAYSFILYCLDKDKFHIKICIQYSYPSMTIIHLFYSTYSIHSMHQYLWYEGPYMSTEFRFKFEISSRHVVKYVPQFRK